MMLVQSDAEIAYCKMLDVWEGSDVEHIPKITDKVCILDARRYDVLHQQRIKSPAAQYTEKAV